MHSEHLGYACSVILLKLLLKEWSSRCFGGGSWAQCKCVDQDEEVVLVAEAFIAHVLAQSPAVRYEARNGDAHVIIHLEDLLGCIRQRRLCPIQS